MKRLFMLTILIFCLSAPCFAREQGAYCNVRYGPNFLILPPILVTEREGKAVTYHTKVGTFYGGSYGHFFKNWCVEGELGYRKNTIDKLVFSGDTLPTGIAGKVKSQSLSLNAIRYLPINACIQPYLGIGAGYSRTDLRISRGDLATGNPDIAVLDGSLKKHRISRDVMNQGIMGVKYAPIPSASINLDYRYVGGWRTRNVNQALTLSLQSQY